jgi:putative transposase
MASSIDKRASDARRAQNRARAGSSPDERVRARPIHANTRVKITRRCLERRMFLTTGADPEELRNYYGYTLGVSLERYGVEMHAACQMGNHHHLDVTDVHGNRPAFKDSLHANLARGLNAKRGRFDKFWEGGGSCDTCAPTDEETLEDLAYTELNPVKAGLVKWGHRWPGFTTYGWKFGETRTFKRPSWFYDPNNPENPDEVQITRVRPKIFMDLSDDELWDLLMKRIRELELQVQAQMRRENRRFMGEKKLSKQTWDRKPDTTEDRFTINPTVASSSHRRRWAELQRNRAWQREYAKARAELRAGKKPVFPAGTYQLRLIYGVQVAQAPP